MRDLYSCMVSTCYIKCGTLLIGMVGCFVYAHHDHQTEWNEDTTYELGEGGEGKGGDGRSRGRTDQGLDKVSVLLTPNNPLKSLSWSDNGQLLILVPSQVICTPLKHR